MTFSIQNLRNVAIIAHVDHGKTTLIDALLKQTGTLNQRQQHDACIMDSNELEKERGITIVAKNTAIEWGKYRINIVDTPGHADFGGEVERILSMVDSVLLLVDAVDGPMPQTRFVAQKALEKGLKPIVVINKIDRDGSRPDWVINQVFELFDELDASESQLDFSILYASALQGRAMLDLNKPNEDMDPLLQTIVDTVNHPDVDENGPFQMQISALDYSTYQGTIGIGRIARGKISSNTPVKIIDENNEIKSGRVLQILRLIGLTREEVPEAQAGDIVAITGIDELYISNTVCDPTQVEALPAMTVDEPTISMLFVTNNSPFAGKEGQFVTSRKLKERLEKELLHNVSLRVENTEDPDKFRVSGRGELHLSILIESMRREGYELAISRPEVILKEVDGQLSEPYELLTLNFPQSYQGSIMEKMGLRKGKLMDMQLDSKDRMRLDYIIPTRGLIGFFTEFLTLTAGNGLMHHVFEHYGPIIKETIQHRSNGVLIANMQGTARGFALWNLQARGKLFISPQTPVYEGMIVGMHSRENNLVVNVCKEKQLTNVRASGTDENIVLTPHIKLTLEQALSFITEDELIEITPKTIRLRMKALKEHERKRAKRA